MSRKVCLKHTCTKIHTCKSSIIIEYFNNIFNLRTFKFLRVELNNRKIMCTYENNA